MAPKQIKAPLKWWRDCRRQDLIEYALLAGFAAFTVAATVSGVTSQLGAVVGRVNSVLTQAAGPASPAAGQLPALPPPQSASSRSLPVGGENVELIGPGRLVIGNEDHLPAVRRKLRK